MANKFMKDTKILVCLHVQVRSLGHRSPHFNFRLKISSLDHVFFFKFGLNYWVQLLKSKAQRQEFITAKSGLVAGTQVLPALGMVVKIAIWILRSHNFTIPPHQNDQNRTRIVKMVGSCKIIQDRMGSYRSYQKHNFFVFFFFWINFLF